MAEHNQQAFFVDDELVERLLRGDSSASGKASRPAAAPSLAQAVEQAAVGHLDDAAITLDRAAQQGEDQAEVYSALGHVRFEQQLWEEAAECYGKVAVLGGPQTAIARYNRGLALERQGKFEEAAAEFETASEQDPELWQAFSALGCCLLRLSQWDKALASLETTLRFQPDHAPTLQAKATAIEAMASQAMEKADYAQAAQLYSQATALTPDSYEMWFNLGVARHRGGRLDQAMAAYTEAARIHPGSAEAHANMGSVLQARNEMDAAVEAYEAALRRTPDMPGVLWNVAVGADQSRQGDLAERYFTRLVEVAPDFEDAEFRLGFLQLQQGKYADAAASFGACVARRPDWLDAHLNLGLAHWKCENLDAAEAAFEQARAIDATNPEARRAVLAIAIERGYLDSAWEMLQRVDQDAGFENIFNLGLSLQQAGRHEQAAECYRRAAAQSPSFAPALLNLGHALNALGRQEEAHEAWTKAVEADPQLAASYFRNPS